MKDCFIKLFKPQGFHVEDSRLEKDQMIITVRPKDELSVLFDNVWYY